MSYLGLGAEPPPERAGKYWDAENEMWIRKKSESVYGLQPDPFLQTALERLRKACHTRYEKEWLSPAKTTEFCGALTSSDDLKSMEAKWDPFFDKHAPLLLRIKKQCREKARVCPPEICNALTDRDTYASMVQECERGRLRAHAEAKAKREAVSMGNKCARQGVPPELIASCVAGLQAGVPIEEVVEKLKELSLQQPGGLPEGVVPPVVQQAMIAAAGRRKKLLIYGGAAAAAALVLILILRRKK